jgi:hypothetical protein
VCWKWLLVVPLLTAAACGGGASDSSGGGGSAPGIPPAVAAALATRADAVAADLQAGNGCAARDRFYGLRGAVARAVAEDRIPVRLQAPLESAVASLGSRITCTPPKPPEHKPPAHDHHKKHEKHGEGD